MLPSDTRLINGIRQALGHFATPERSAEDRRVVASIEVALNELLRRQDHAFIAAQVAAGEALEAEAVGHGAAALAETDGKTPLDRLMRSLEAAVTTLVSRETADPAVKDLLSRIVDWENALYARRLQPPPPLAENGDAIARFPAEAIEQYLRKKFPDWVDVRVSGVRQLSGGFSKTTVLFDIEDKTQGQRSLVIRASQAPTLLFLEGADLRNEYHLLKYVNAAGVPVAEPLWLEEETTSLGPPLLVSRRAPGRNFGSRVDARDAISDGLLRDVIRRLVQIHSLKIDPNDPHIAASHLGRLAQFKTLTDCITEEIRFWRAQSQSFGLGPSPILARTYEWLARNVPENDAPPALIHGDFGLHNVLIGDDDRVSCILDWEGASLGDPANDLVWLADGLKGQVERSKIIALYQELGGGAISPARLHYFDVMNTVRFAVTCPRALYLFEQYPGMSVDACQLGLLYMYHGTGALNQNIALAEKAMRG